MLNELKHSFGNYLAFSRESMLALTEAYHDAWSPLPLVGLLLGIVIFALILTNRISFAGWPRATLIVTGLAWMLIGAVWQLHYLAQLDWSAAPTGWAMLIQGLLLILFALIVRPEVRPQATVRLAALLTAALGGFGFALLQWLNGLPFSQLDRFGVDAGSTALLTAAVVMLLPRKHLWLLLIPWLWSARHFTVSWPLGDRFGMLLLPWLSVCILISFFCKRKHDE